MSAQQPVLCALALVNIRCTILVCRCLSSSTDPLVWIDLWLCRYNPAGGGKPYMVAVKRLKMELFRCGFLGWASPRSVVLHKLLALSDRHTHFKRRTSQFQGECVRLVPTEQPLQVILHTHSGVGQCLHRQQTLAFSLCAGLLLCRNQEDLDMFVHEVELMRKLRHRYVLGCCC